MNILFSPRLRYLLSITDHPYSVNLSEFDNSKKSDITLIDIGKNNLLTFTYSKDIPKDKFLYTKWDGNISKIVKSRNEIKIGKFVRRLMDVNDTDLENFVNKLKANLLVNEFEFEIVSLDVIEKYYKSRYYNSNGGSLNNSCMLDKPSEYFDLYTSNKNCEMLILKSGNSIVGRALLWRVESLISKEYEDLPRLELTDVYMLDRVYSTQDYLVDVFLNYAKKNDWVTKKYNNRSSNKFIVYRNNSYYDADMVIKLDKFRFRKYPYLDTFSRLYKGKLYNDLNLTKGGKILTEIDGGYKKGDHLLKRAFNKIMDKIMDKINA